MKKWNRLMKTHFIVLFSVLLLSCTLLCGLIVGAGFAASDETWNNHTSAMIYSGGYYNIGTAEQLAYFNKNLSTYKSSNIRLTADIDMSKYNNKVCYWVPTQVAFRGVFDGQGHTISGIRIQDGSGNTNSGSSMAGLFYTIAEPSGGRGAVKNLVLKDFTINGVTHAGALAGKVWTSDITNVKVYKSTIKGENLGTTNLSDNIHVGGICGAAVNESTITNCWVNGCTIIASNTKSGVENHYGTVLNTLSGGIVGWGSKLQIEGCKSDGNYVFTYNPSLRTKKIYICDSYAGGIVGELTGTWGNTKVSRCSNTSNVYGGMDAGSSNCNIERSMVGGIAGRLGYGKIENCYNTGSLSGYGKLNDEIVKDDISLMTSDSIDLGKKDGATFKIEKNGKYGIETNKFNDINIGGIVGIAESYSSIMDCYNIGNISRESYQYNKEIKLEYLGHTYEGNKSQLETGIVFNFLIKDSYSYINDIIGRDYGCDVYRCYCQSKIFDDLESSITFKYSNQWTSLIKRSGSNSGYDQFSFKTGIYYIYYTVHYTFASGLDLHYPNWAWNTFDTVFGQTDDVFGFKELLGLDKNYLYINIGGSLLLFDYAQSTICSDGTEGISVSSSTLSSDYWSVDSNINGGLPHLKDFYWQDS